MTRLDDGQQLFAAPPAERFLGFCDKCVVFERFAVYCSSEQVFFRKFPPSVHRVLDYSSFGVFVVQHQDGTLAIVSYRNKRELFL